MPTAGIVLPTHSEYEADQQGRAPNWAPLEEAIQRAQHWHPKRSPWPYELLHAILSDQIEHKGKHERVSATMLLGCPRSAVLERKEDYIATLDDFYRMLRGTMVHRTLEKSARPGALVEAHFLTEIEGIEFSAKPDIITPDGDLMDYKVVEKVPQNHYPWRSNTLQVQYTAYAIRHAKSMTLNKGEPNEEKYEGNIPAPNIRSCTLVYLGPDGPKPITVEAKLPHVFPGGREGFKNKPYVWSDDEVLKGHGYREHGSDSTYHKNEAGLVERVQAMRLALDMYPDFPPEVCEIWGGKPEDGWRCPGKPWCKFPNCLAKRYPNGLTWERDEDAE